MSCRDVDTGGGCINRDVAEPSSQRTVIVVRMPPKASAGSACDDLDQSIRPVIDGQAARRVRPYNIERPAQGPVPPDHRLHPDERPGPQRYILVR